MRTKCWDHMRKNHVRTYRPSTREVVLFRVIFNEFVLAFEVINTIVMNSKYNNIDLYISPFIHVYDICVAQNSRGHFAVANIVVQSIVFVNTN